jgi:cobalt/nickel transport system permease protein
MLSGLRGQVAAVAFAGWCSTVVASVACAGQLAWSGTVGWAAAFPAMTGIHMLIGIGEGAISALVFFAVAKARPELAADTSALPKRTFIGYGLLVAIGVALFAAPFACRWPDGLEAVAAKLGFEHAAKEPAAAPMMDYAMSGVATALAGVVGTLVAFGLAVFLSRLLVKNESTPAKTNANA